MKRRRRAGRPRKPAGRGDSNAVQIAVRLTKAETAALDVARGTMSRSAYIRAQLVAPTGDMAVFSGEAAGS